MARQRDGSRRPGFPKITRIEISEKHFRLRAGLAIGFLVLGILAIAFALFSLLHKEPGWQTVEATPSGPSCAADFQLQYDFSEDGGSATAAYRQLSQRYTEAVEAGYRIFSADVGAMMMVQPVGGFLTLGCLIALMQWAQNRNKEGRK